MGKLLDCLQAQLKSEEHKKDAEDCIKIYEELLRIWDGSIWSSDWNPLTTVKFKGTYPNSVKIYKPSEQGYIFLRGIKEKKEREAGVQYVFVKESIVSHLSDAQELSNRIVAGRWGFFNKEANKHINFAKKLLLEYPDTSVEISEKQLDELWKNFKN